MLARSHPFHRSRQRGPTRPSALLGFCVLAVTACVPDPEVAVSRPNVLFLTIDTLRADHLTSYGYGRKTSPSLDALAQGAVLFERAEASSSWTLPTLASVMTGYFTSTHGCWKRRSRLSPAFETLPEILRDAGYDTGCVISHTFLARTYGLQQGFVHFDTGFDRTDAHGDMEISSPRVSDAGIEWIENKAESPDNAPWFLWLHYFDPHFKYMSHGGEEAPFGGTEPIDFYDGEIEFTDSNIGRVLDALARTGLDERTIVVLFADHGEEFEDHGWLYHGHTLHGELTRVPLILRAPGFAPRRVSHPVRTVDIMPTILDLAGLPEHEGIAGRSLVPSMHGETQDLPGLAELRLLGEGYQYDSLVDGDWKLIYDRAAESVRLFHIKDDPDEQVDVATRFPDRAEAMGGELRALIHEAEGAAKLYAPVADLELSAEEAEHLHELGYAGGDD